MDRKKGMEKDSVDGLGKGISVNAVEDSRSLSPSPSPSPSSFLSPSPQLAQAVLQTGRPVLVLKLGCFPFS